MKKLIAICTAILLLACVQSEAISLTWDALPDVQGVLQYNLYRVKHGGADLMTTVSPPLVTVNVDAYLLSGNRTSFYVTATNSVGEGPASVQVTVQRH